MPIEGQLFKRGESICREGADDGVKAHFRFSLSKGSITNSGWIKNSNNAYVLAASNGASLANNGFYIDSAFTTIDSRSLNLGLNILPS